MGEEVPQAQPQWEGKVTAELKRSSPQQVWPFLADFCNLHKILPGVETCRQVEGVPNEPGLTRHCRAPATDDVDESTVNWANEKLMSIDPIKRCLSYEIVDSNMGFKSYVAAMQVVPVKEENGGEGCEVEWSFVCHPIEGMGLDVFVSYMQTSIQGIAKNIEDALLQASTSSNYVAHA